MPTIYTFEAKSIQNYILDSSKLKDMIGASEQIEYLCHEDGLLDQVLNSLDLNDTEFARRAGGAFQAIFSNNDDAKRFQAVWTFCVQQTMPGLNFAQGIGTNDNDLKKAIDESEQAFKQDDHTRLSFTFPLAGPLVARSPRTGQPAVSYNKTEERIERIDSITETKRQFSKGTLLIDKLNDFDVEIDWPINLDNKDKELKDEKTFPLLKDNNYIAIIHADVNNLGQLFQTLREELLENSEITEYPNTLTQISQIIKDSIEQSAKQVTKDILSKEANIQTNKKADKKFIMPARPLVLGGDDFTFIVRGDLALKFTQEFLEKFEETTKKEFNKLQSPKLVNILPKYLTACAGIVYIKASQPFFRAYTLVESLCKQAKTFSRGHRDKNKLIPSSIIFHRITSSIIDDYNTILDEELTTSTGIRITMQPYLVGQVEPSSPKKHECIRLDDLYELSNFLKDDTVSHGTVREFLTMLEINRQQAEQGLKRWYDNMVSRKENLVPLQEILETLVKSPDHKFYQDNPTKLKFIGNFTEKNKCTPLGDALALIHINKGSDYVSN